MSRYNTSEKHFFVDDPKKYPQCEHFALIHFNYRSRDDGYGGTYYAHEIEYEVFLDEEAWQAEILKLTLDKTYTKPFNAVFVKAAKVVTSARAEL